MADAPPAETASPGDPRLAHVRLLLQRFGPVALATLDALAEMDAEAPPFAHPVHWAGFALRGRG